MAELVKQLQEASDAYYNGEPIMDDEVFDALVDQLRKIDPKNEFLETVGKDSGEFEKRAHKMFLGSQQKAANPKEFEKWCLKGYSDFVVNHKIDGLSIELVYKNGVFKYGITRGNGKVGDDVTANVLLMQGLTKKIKGFSGSVRGEIVMSRKVFEKKYSIDGHKMPRTTASGLTKRPDGVGCRDLMIVVYDVSDFDTEKAKMRFLSENFKFVASTRNCKSGKDVLKWYDELVGGEREELDIEIDGLVIKCNQVDKEDMKRVKPMRQIALKFPSRQVTSVLKKVVWNVSGSVLTPVAHIDPVVIDGSTVTKASLCNPGIMKRLGIRIGSRVMVIKSNDIIPKIIAVTEEGNGQEIEIPYECTSCQTELVNKETKLYCPNEDCPAKVSHQIRKWISVLDVKEFGKELITQIDEASLVQELADIYELDVDVVSELVGGGGKKIGMKNAQKAIGNLKAIKEVSLAKFIAGFDITGISEKTIELLEGNGFDTLEKLRTADITSLTGVKGIGQSKAEALLAGLNKMRGSMNKMLGYVKIAKPVVVQGGLTGKSFCFTGALSVPRKKAEEMVKAKGGTCKTTVTRGLSYLVTDDPESGSAKNVKALKDGVMIISEAEFLKMV
jgi:DNA ligase (NAD+)